jgi:3-oxoacyl-[acyl-carrier protein] reductase
MTGQSTKATAKTAIITGASRGIGATVAERLAGDGFNVVINYSSNAAPADALAAKIGTAAIAVKGDVADPVAMRALFDAADAKFGGVDVLVNNAGIMQLATFADASDTQFDRQFDVNVKGTFNTMREAAKRLRNGGRVINFSTSVVGTRFESYGIYAATKAAVETMTAIMAREMRGREITVNAIAPGPTATELFLKGKPPELVDRIAKMNPLERLGTTDDIANAVAFLAGPEGGWINGQTIRTNGGMV